MELSKKEKEIRELEKLQQEYYDKAWELKFKIEQLKLKDINFEGKFIAKSCNLGVSFDEFMIVRSQQITQVRGKREVVLTGLVFYMEASTCYDDAAEVYFSGNHSWFIPIDDFLNLDKNKKLKEIDKDTFMKEVKGCTKTIESFINGWLDRFIKDLEIEKDEQEKTESTIG